LAPEIAFKQNRSTRFQGKAMKKKDLDYFKELLTNRLEELLSQADDTVSGMTAPKENFPDPTDRASLEADRNFMLRIRDRESKLIKKIKKTLNRIENGTFGICETCGDDIGIKRLKARPVTTQCIECKTKAEALEKSLGL
jgi:DnaK suppressor protein